MSFSFTIHTTHWTVIRIKPLTDLYKKTAAIETDKKKLKSELLNNIAWGFVEIKEFNAEALKIINESIALDSSPEAMDTLATIHAGMGNYKEAVKTEKEALKKNGKGRGAESMEANLRLWKCKLKISQS